MNFSTEEIYAMYGQYDTFVIIEFTRNSDEFSRFGKQLMGTFSYTLDERKELELIFKREAVSRTDSKIKFNPSEVEKLSPENVEFLDRFGIQSSSIIGISTFDMPKTNRFVQKGIKEIPNQVVLKSPKINGWQELNQLRFGFLNSLYKAGKKFSPYQEIEYWGLRTHLEMGLDSDDYLEILNKDKDFLKKVKHIELDCKFQELTINEEQIQELMRLKVEEIFYKKDIIDKEIQMSSENIKNVSSNFKTEIDELKKCCYGFNEDVIGFGDKLVYLNFERFVHIYARHVAETQIGERFSGDKTVFQYKLEDIKHLIRMVVESVNDEIQVHFKENPQLPFRRLGKRAIYIDGHYYRLVIDKNGSIQDFHPYNVNEE
ncbi:MAG: hypothetical protein J7574_09455 [Flavobacterium sp.]|uniref:hypothetical protein n=1 Tax=Flavobacterium sp. TaxID=239 RepID=UPI001B264C77|nr:hypothetical protein [Flavobacterium sp.]MBO9584371.1 hypothetical protein [Flavobacterium sp.]